MVALTLYKRQCVMDETSVHNIRNYKQRAEERVIRISGRSVNMIRRLTETRETDATLCFNVENQSVTRPEHLYNSLCIPMMTVLPGWTDADGTSRLSLNHDIEDKR
jgi:hypothetical protein